MHIAVAVAVAAALAVACAGRPAPSTRDALQVEVRDFGRTKEGATAKLYTLHGPTGMTAKISDYGATLVELWVPGADGKATDVVLGYPRVEDYVAAGFYLGATLGRVANRIANGTFTLDGKTYTLATNRPPNALHGGFRGFDKRMWTAKPDSTGIAFSYTSAAGEEGYPGTLHVSVHYMLTDRNELRLDYTATTDEPTPVNFTNHSFFNLAGTGTVLDHVLTINAHRYTPMSSASVPTGEIVPVAGTPLDFTTPHRIGERVGAGKVAAGGYDENFVIDRPAGEKGLVRAARLVDPGVGRALEIWTTEPGMQFFTGNRFDGSFPGVGGVVYQRHAGIALEPQHFPDAINHPDWPSVVLRPGQTFRSTTVYRFSSGTRTFIDRKGTSDS